MIHIQDFSDCTTTKFKSRMSISILPFSVGVVLVGDAQAAPTHPFFNLAIKHQVAHTPLSRLKRGIVHMLSASFMTSVTKIFVSAQLNIRTVFKSGPSLRGLVTKAPTNCKTIKCRLRSTMRLQFPSHSQI